MNDYSIHAFVLVMGKTAPKPEPAPTGSRQFRSRLRTNGFGVGSAPTAPESAPHQRVRSNGSGVGFNIKDQKNFFNEVPIEEIRK